MRLQQAGDVLSGLQGADEKQVIAGYLGHGSGRQVGRRRIRENGRLPAGRGDGYPFERQAVVFGDLLPDALEMVTIIAALRTTRFSCPPT